ncbi:MAG: sialidase [Blastopirellula sp.]|nr:MAG: sialidase [Blastopirellula sp.]
MINFKQTISLTATFCALHLVTSACLAESPTTQPGFVLEEFIYEKAPFPQCHASTIVETPQGIVAAWFGGTHEKSPDVGIWLSHKKDGKWSTPVEVANGVQADKEAGKPDRYPTWNPVLHQIPDGPLQLYYKKGPSPSTWWGELKESTDGGHTWSKARRLPRDIYGPVRNKAITLKDGTILSPSSTEHDGWRVHFELSSDNGKTWKLIGPVNDGKEFSAIQPTVLTHPGGKLQALCRSKESKIVETWSDDDGLTWSKMAATSLPNPNSGIDAVTLQDGRHLLIYNHTLRKSGWGGSRSFLNVAISDDGKSWKPCLILEQEDKGEFSYPAVIQSSDGLVHITYTHLRTKVKHVVVNPKKLVPTEYINGNWPLKN